jgi:hypothetical protein
MFFFSFLDVGNANKVILKDQENIDRYVTYTCIMDIGTESTNDFDLLLAAYYLYYSSQLFVA